MKGQFIFAIGFFFFFPRSHVHFTPIESVEEAALRSSYLAQSLYYVPKCFFHMFVLVAKLPRVSYSYSPTALILQLLNFPYENHLPGGPWVTSLEV